MRCSIIIFNNLLLQMYHVISDSEYSCGCLNKAVGRRHVGVDIVYVLCVEIVGFII